jgi:hypothetical protein
VLPLLNALSRPIGAEPESGQSRWMMAIMVPLRSDSSGRDRRAPIRQQRWKGAVGRHEVGASCVVGQTEGIRSSAHSQHDSCRPREPPPPTPPPAPARPNHTRLSHMTAYRQRAIASFSSRLTGSAIRAGLAAPRATRASCRGGPWRSCASHNRKNFQNRTIGVESFSLSNGRPLERRCDKICPPGGVN